MSEEYLDAREARAREAAAAGAAAFAGGQSEKSNPYNRREDRVGHEAWRDGWRNAFWTAKDRENPEAA